MYVHPSMYINHKSIYVFKLNWHRYTCSIPDPDLQRVTITGGVYTSTVSVYGVLGWIEDLKPLVQRRNDHACSSFLSGQKRVIIETYYSNVINALRPILDSDGYWRLWWWWWPWLDGAVWPQHWSLENKWSIANSKEWAQGNYIG